MLRPTADDPRRVALFLVGFQNTCSMSHRVACDAASRTPRRELTFDPMRGSIGGVRLGDPISDVVRLFGKPDRIVPIESDPVYLWLRGKALCTVWAQTYAARKGSRKTVLINYAGPLRTAKEDRVGTPLAAVRRHWRNGHYIRARDVTGGRGANYGLVTHYGSATFAFDERKQLAGVSIQTSEQYWQPVLMKCS